VHVVLAHVQPVPDIDTSVSPEGTVSVIVTAPLVGAVPVFDTVTVYVAFCWPWEKLPVCANKIVRTGTGAAGDPHPATITMAIRAEIPRVRQTTLVRLDRKSLRITAILFGL
jgi:hypothetical protein